MNSNYRQHLIGAVKDLQEAEQILFTSALNLAWSGELSPLEDGYQEGDVMAFDVPLLQTVEDLNVKKIVALLNKLTDAAEYIKNVNKITDEELTTAQNTQGY